MRFCKQCMHSVMCMLRNELEGETIKKFPDGKLAILDLENAVTHCDHFAMPPLSRDEYQEERVEVDPILADQVLPDIEEEPEFTPQTIAASSKRQVLGIPVEESPAEHTATASYQEPQVQGVLRSDEGPVTRLGQKKLKLKLGGMQ